MSSLTAKFAERLRNNPLIVLSVIATLLVVAANAGPALDQAERLWIKLTKSYPPLETVWQGTWTSRSGFTFNFAMQLDVKSDNSAAGRIRWQLAATPKDSFLAPRVGETAYEYVSGRFHREQRLASVDGYEVSDPTLLALDSYRFKIESDNVSFVGMTRYRGEWEAEAKGKVIVTEKPPQ